MSSTKKHSLLLKEWVKRLTLGDWAIVLAADCVPADMKLDDVAGEVAWIEASKTAVIRILKDGCYGTRARPFDFEKTLVHELLHVKFCLIDQTDNDIHDRVLHQLIDDMARALIDAKRNGASDKRTHKEASQ